MKFLRNEFNKLNSSDWERFLWMETTNPDDLDKDAEPVEEMPEDEQGVEYFTLDKILNSPLSFSIRKLQFLENHGETLTETQKEKFRDLIGYFLTTNESISEGGIPSRVLFRLYTKSPKLRGYLHPYMEEKLKSFITSQKESLKNLASNGHALTRKTIAQACGIYKYLEKEGVDPKGEFDPVFKTAKEKLLKTAIPLLHRYNEVAESVPENVERIIKNEEKGGPLSATEKLILHEIYSLFPNKEDWGREEHFESLSELTGTIESDFKEKRFSLDKDDYVMAELLDEFANSSNLGVFTAEKALEINIKRANAIRFMDFAKTQEVMLPSHLDVLNEIRNGDEFLFDAEIEKEGEDSAEKLQKLDNELTVPGLSEEAMRKGEKQKQELEQKKINNERRKKLKDEAQEVKDEYLHKLEDRIRLHRLRSADMEVLLRDAEDKTENKTDTAETKNIEIESKFLDMNSVIDFRNAFQDVLSENVIPGLKKELSETSNYTEWTRMFDEYLSVRKMKPLLSVIPRYLESSAALSAAINGMTNRYRGLISAELAPTTGGIEKFNKYFNTWQNGKRIASNQEIENLKANQKKVTEQGEQTGELIESERRSFDALVESIEHESEQEKLEPTFKQRTEWLRDGHVKTIDEETGEKVFIPGVDGTRKAGLETADIRKNVQEIVDKLEGKTIQLRNDAREGKDQVGLQKTLSDLCNEWDTDEEELRHQIKESGKVLSEIFNPGFAEMFKRQADKYLDVINEGFKEIKERMKDEDFYIRGDEYFFDGFTNGLKALKSFMDFTDGFWQSHNKRAEEDFQDGNAGIQYLKQLGYFEDEDSTKQKFKEELEKAREGTTEVLNEFQEWVDKLEKAVEKDLIKMTDHEFLEKYGLSRRAVTDLISSYTASKDAVIEQWKVYQNPDFVKNWSKLYEKDTEGRNYALNEIMNFKRITETCPGMKEGITNIKNWLAEKNKTEKDFAKKPLQWQAFSLYDLWRIVKESFDAQEKQWKRDSDTAVSQIGQSFWGTRNRFGKEFNRMGEASESERVKEYEENYGDFAAWQLWNIVGKARDKDELRALINLLSKKGVLKWEDPVLWQGINRFATTTFDESIDRKKPYNQIRDKMRTSCSEVWDSDVFDAWERSIKGDRSSAQDPFENDFASYESNGAMRHEILAGMLRDWKNGNTDQVDPARYEMFLRMAFRNGKMNGQPEPRYYYLAQGLAVRNPQGQSIMGQDVFQRFTDEFLPRFPHIDFFSDSQSPKLNGRIVPEGTPGSTKRAWTIDDYAQWGEVLGDSNGTFNPTQQPAYALMQKFWYTNVHKSTFAKDRAQRMQRMAGEQGDHDDAWVFFGAWTAGQVKEQLGMNSSGLAKNSPDFWRTYLSAFPNFMKSMNEYIKEGDEEWGQGDFWLKEREATLKEIGEKLQVAMLCTQSLLGNYTTYNETRPMVLGKEEWDKPSTAYSISITESKNEINTFMKDVFEARGENEEGEFKEIFEARCADAGRNDMEIKKLQDEKKKAEVFAIKKKSDSLITESTGGKYFSEDLGAIEKALIKYCDNSEVLKNQATGLAKGLGGKNL